MFSIQRRRVTFENPHRSWWHSYFVAFNLLLVSHRRGKELRGVQPEAELLFLLVFCDSGTLEESNRNGSLSLVDFQLDAQNSYLFTYNAFIEILYMFRALPCSSSEGLRRNCLYAASGIVTVCRWLSCAPVKKELFLTGAQDSHLQRVTIPEAAYIQLRRRPPEDEQGNALNM